VRPARPDDVAAVRRIGVDAGRRFAEIPDPRVARCADDPPFEADELLPAIAEGCLWVAVHPARTGGDEPVGFLLAVLLDGSLHVEELAVAPAHERAGHGGRLLEAADGAAWSLGRPALTLTTFADVPWNRPYYERRGFRVLDEVDLDDELRRIREDEAGHGLDPATRVVMARPTRGRDDDSTPSGASS